MSEKTVNRNDPCPCGSGKKFKVCCMNKPKPSGGYALGKRKFTAKLLTPGADQKSTPEAEEARKQSKGMIDYNMLMERAYGEAIKPKNSELTFPTELADYTIEKRNNNE